MQLLAPLPLRSTLLPLAELCSKRRAALGAIHVALKRLSPSARRSQIYLQAVLSPATLARKKPMNNGRRPKQLAMHLVNGAHNLRRPVGRVCEHELY